MADADDFSECAPTQTSIPISDFPEGDDLWRLRSIGKVRAEDNDHRVELFLQRQRKAAPTVEEAEGGASEDDGWTLRFGDSWEEVVSRIEMPVGILPVTRVGSTWRRGELVNSTERIAQTERFNLSDVRGPGEILAPSAYGDFFAKHYFLPGSSYGCPILQTEARLDERFDQPQCTVIFPCAVIFTDLFAPTSRVARLLLRYPEDGESWERNFWFNGSRPPRRGTWFDAATRRLHVCLSKRVDNAARQHIALWFHDVFARSEAERIHTFRSSQSAKSRQADGSVGKTGAGLRVRLPFEGSRKMRVAGLLRTISRFETGRGWVERMVLLVHQILWCELSLPGVDVLEYERENPGNSGGSAKVDDTQKRPTGGKESAPELGKDDKIDGAKGARADQRAIEWEVAAPANLFKDVVVRKVNTVDPADKQSARDRPATDRGDQLSVGSGDYRKDSVSQVEILQTDRAAAILEEFVDDPGFDFLAKVLWHLGTLGWEAQQVLEEGWTMIDERPRRVQSFSHPARRIFVARLKGPEREAYLIEFEHERVEGRWTAQTATLIAHPQLAATSIEALLEFVVRSGPHGPSLASPPAELGTMWTMRLVRHRYSPVRSGKDVRLVHAENLALALDPQNSKYRTRAQAKP